MFEIGDKFASTCIFTGGSHNYRVVSRTETVIHCEIVYHEIDGIHKGTEDYEIHTDENGREYIVLWKYRDHEGRYYADRKGW